MPTLAEKDDRHIETGAQRIQTTPHTQGWWRDSGNNDMLSLGDQTYSSIMVGTVRSQGNNETAVKEMEVHAPLSGSNTFDGKPQQRQRQQLDINSQMELVGHSIMVTPYPYPDPQHGGITAYGALTQQHFFGYHPARMPLPLEMEEEPVYVNAKQYHGILRRRQIRARAELEKKVVKARKPYLHESRHKHAMRRARGSGGRFLNTKKLDGSKTPTTEVQSAYTETSPTQSGTERLSSSYNRISHEQNSGSLGQELHKEQAFSDANSNGHGLSLYYTQSARSQPGNGHLYHDNQRLKMNQGPHGAASGK